MSATVETTTLTDFLLARIAEDAAAARDAFDYAQESHPVGTVTWSWSAVTSRSSRVISGSPSPARVLAECEAKRRIVGLHPEILTICQECASESWPCRTLQTLALPYADHLDYRDEWRP